MKCEVKRPEREVAESEPDLREQVLQILREHPEYGLRTKSVARIALFGSVLNSRRHDPDPRVVAKIRFALRSLEKAGVVRAERRRARHVRWYFAGGENVEENA